MIQKHIQVVFWVSVHNDIQALGHFPTPPPLAGQPKNNNESFHPLAFIMQGKNSRDNKVTAEVFEPRVQQV